MEERPSATIVPALRVDCEPRCRMNNAKKGSVGKPGSVEAPPDGSFLAAWKAHGLIVARWDSLCGYTLCLPPCRKGGDGATEPEERQHGSPFFVNDKNR